MHIILIRTLIYVHTANKLPGELQLLLTHKHLYDVTL